MTDDSARLLRREKEEEEGKGRRPQQAQAFMDAGDVSITEERAERMLELEVLYDRRSLSHDYSSL